MAWQVYGIVMSQYESATAQILKSARIESLRVYPMGIEFQIHIQEDARRILISSEKISGENVPLSTAHSYRLIHKVFK